MSTQPVHPDASEIDAAHRRAVAQWKEYFEQETPLPEDSLLSLLTRQIDRIPSEHWAAFLFRLKLVNEEDVKEIYALLVTPEHDKPAMTPDPDNKTWAMFLSAMHAMRYQQDPDLHALYALTNSVSPNRGALPRFVKHCWDGYFLYSRAVASQLKTQYQAWPMDIPAIGVGKKGKPKTWKTLSRAELEDHSNTGVWQELKDEGHACLQTRFVKHEYQMPALWQALTKPARKEDAFTAVKKNVDAIVNIKDMGVSPDGTVRRRLTFQRLAGAPRPLGGTKKFFGLPGLLWAMGLDGGLRRNRQITTIAQDFDRERQAIQRERFTMTENLSKPFYPAAEVLPIVQNVVTDKPASQKNTRLAVSEATTTAMNWNLAPVLFLDIDSVASHTWLVDERIHVLRISDSRILRLTSWKDKKFHALAGYKDMPVVFGIEGPDGKVQEWAWGSSEDWGVEENGATTFEIWPWVKQEHAFRQEKFTPHVTNAMMIDMAKFGDFRDGYCVLYLQICWLLFPPKSF